MPDAPVMDSLTNVTPPPALSATSDMPVVETQPDATARGPDPEPTLAPGADPTPEVEAAGDPAPATPEPRGVGKKLAELEAARAAAEQKAADAIAEAAADRKRFLDTLEAFKPKVADPEPAASKPRPVREAFDSPDAYDAALIEWASATASEATALRLKQETDAAAGRQRETEARETANKQLATLHESFNDKVGKLAEKYPDFDAVARSEAVPISGAMGFAIYQAENGPDVAYHLGKNIDEAKRIAALPDTQQILEIGRLAGRLSAPPPVQVSKTPEPISPLRGQSADATAKSPDEMSMDEYAAHRLTTLNAERTARMQTRH